MPTHSPTELWTGFHVQKGDSAQASSLALAELTAINTRNFTDQTQANDHGEYARIAAVTALAAARKSSDWTQARKHLLDSIQAVSSAYPIASTAQEAETRGDYWQGVYNKESAQLICLRDILKLSTFLNDLLKLSELTSFVTSVQALLTRLSSELQGERFGLIFMIESYPYPQAKVAFQEFVEKFSTNSELHDANQIITVASSFLRRALVARDPAQILSCLRQIPSAIRTNLKLAPFAAKQLGKSLLEPYQARQREKQTQAWAGEITRDHEVQDAAKRLTTLRQLGLGAGRVEPITE